MSRLQSQAGFRGPHLTARSLRQSQGRYSISFPQCQGDPRESDLRAAQPQLQPLPPDGGLFAPVPAPALLWKGSFEAGLSGATGNSENVNAHMFATADRKTDSNLLHTDLLYLLGKEDGKSTQNNMIANLRDEILFAGSPWSLFGSSFYDYDELRDYKTIIGLYAGLGYLVSDTDTQLFKLRAGAGTIYKTSGSAVPGHLWEPSLDLGYDYKYKFNERSALVSTLDYYPSVDKGFGEFLLRMRKRLTNAPSIRRRACSSVSASSNAMTATPAPATRRAT